MTTNNSIDQLICSQAKAFWDSINDAPRLGVQLHNKIKSRFESQAPKCKAAVKGYWKLLGALQSREPAPYAFEEFYKDFECLLEDKEIQGFVELVA